MRISPWALGQGHERSLLVAEVVKTFGPSTSKQPKVLATSAAKLAPGIEMASEFGRCRARVEKARRRATPGLFGLYSVQLGHHKRNGSARSDGRSPANLLSASCGIGRVIVIALLNGEIARRADTGECTGFGTGVVLRTKICLSGWSSNELASDLLRLKLLSGDSLDAFRVELFA